MRLARKPGLFSLADARCYWLFVAAVAAYGVFGRVNTPPFMWPVLGSLVAAGIALHAVRYNWMSFVAVFVIGHVISFPVGTLLVLSLRNPTLAIEPELWRSTPLSLCGMIVGMLGVAAGAVVAKVVVGKYVARHPVPLRPPMPTPLWFNVALMLLIVPVVAVYIYAGVYYHKDASLTADSHLDRAEMLGALGYLVYLSYCGSVLQLRRYVITRRTKDMLYAIVCCAVPMLAMMPSGSRTASMVVLALAFVYYMATETRPALKYVALGATITAFAVLTVSIESYRIAALGSGGNLRFSDRIALMVDSLVPGGESVDHADAETSRARLGRRLSDLHSVGYLMEAIPESEPHIGFKGLPQYFYFLIPTVLRPGNSADFQAETERLRDQYGFRPDIGGSSPMMIIGEFYERFGWTGIFVGMAILGFILSGVDRWIALNGTRGVILWALFIHGVINMHTYFIGKIFVLFTRQLAIFAVLIVLIDRYLASLTPRPPSGRPVVRNLNPRIRAGGR